MDRRTAIAALAAAPLASWGQSSEVLTLGLLPNVSARVLFANWQPFVRYMERTTGRKVELATAPGFGEYHRRTMRGDYDVAVSAANLARLAEKDGAMSAVAIFEPPIEALAVSLQSRPLASLADLRGRKVAMANPQSLVALYGLQWLRDNGLASGTDFEILHTRNDDSLGHALRSGETPLAIMSGGEFRQIAPEVRRELEIHRTFASVPGFFVLTRRDPERVRDWFTGFAASEEGQAFFAAAGGKNIRPITDADRAAVERYVEPTRQRLAAAP